MSIISQLKKSHSCLNRLSTETYGALYTSIISEIIIGKKTLFIIMTLNPQAAVISCKIHFVQESRNLCNTVVEKFKNHWYSIGHGS